MPTLSKDPVVILSAIRTPIGNFMGELSAVKSTDLGAASIRGALATISLPVVDVWLCFAGGTWSGASEAGGVIVWSSNIYDVYYDK